MLLHNANQTESSNNEEIEIVMIILLNQVVLITLSTIYQVETIG